MFFFPPAHFLYGAGMRALPHLLADVRGIFVVSTRLVEICLGIVFGGSLVNVDGLAIDVFPICSAFVIGEGVKEGLGEGGVGVYGVWFIGQEVDVGTVVSVCAAAAFGWGGCAAAAAAVVLGVRSFRFLAFEAESGGSHAGIDGLVHCCEYAIEG